MSVHFSSGKDDWETPDELFQRFNRIYHFTLDAAANHVNHKVDTWFGPGGAVEDALAVDWRPWLERGNIWLNPPYSRKLQTKFVTKAADVVRESIERGVATPNHVVCLLPARTDTKLFHDVILPCVEHLGSSVEFIKGRVKFVGAAHGAPFPSMIVVF